MSIQDGYGLCMNSWALDKDIKSELGLLLIVSSLSAEKGYCYASNEYLGSIFNINPVSISRKLKKLESKKYLKIEYKKRGAEIIKRMIYPETRLTKMLTDDQQKDQPTINKNVKDNIISIKNISNNKRETKVSKRERELLKFQNNLKDFWCDDLKEAIDGWLEVRKGKNTDRSIKLSCNKLIELSGSITKEMIAILNQSTERSYQGLFEIKKGNGSNQDQGLNDFDKQYIIENGLTFI